MSPRSGVGAGLMILLVSATAAAQDSDALRRLERQLRETEEGRQEAVRRDGTLEERLFLDWDGALRFSVSGIDDDRSKSHVLRQTDGRFQVAADLDGEHHALLRLRFRYDDWNAGDDFDGRGDEFETQIADRFWYEWEPGGSDSTFRTRVGKQYVHWGSGLALSRTLYAGRVEAEWGGLEGVLLGGRTPSLTVDSDGSRPGFDRHTQREFLGASIAATLGSHHPFLSALVQRDHNERDTAAFVDGLGQTFSARFEYDSQYFGIGSWGSLGSNWTYEGELSYERGRGLSTPRDQFGTILTQTREDVSAWAATLSVARTFGDRRSSALDFQAVLGSADGDRLDAADTLGGNRSGTTDRAYNSLGYVPTGIALAPGPSNLMALRAGWAFRPFPDSGGTWSPLRVKFDALLLGKLVDDAPLDVATTDDRFVGGEIDLSIDWPLTSDLSFDFRGGLFLPGAAMPRGQDGSRQVLLVGMTYAF